MSEETKFLYSEADGDFLCPLCGAYWQCDHTMPEMVMTSYDGQIGAKITGHFIFRGEPRPMPPLGEVRKLTVKDYGPFIIQSWISDE